MLALDYMRRSRKVTPEVELKALEYINVGYQRLLTFEVKGGGFDWYGQAPANIVLSAYGLLEFSDMAKVYDIDTRVIDRTRAWLFGQQKADGSWPMPQRTAWSWSGLQGDYVVTAYVAMSLAESGYKGKELDHACEWLRDHLEEAKDAYAQSLALGALAVADPQGSETGALLRDLERRRSVSEDGKSAWWELSGKTAYYAQGEAAHVETTALVASGLFRSRTSPETVSRALAYLAQKKRSNGTWGTTSATILSLRAILMALEQPSTQETYAVNLKLNGVERRVTVDKEQSDVLQFVDFRENGLEPAKTGPNDFEVNVEGKSASTIQVVGRSWIPWSEANRPAQKPLDIKVEYDRTTLTTADTLTATVTMKYNGTEPTFMVCMDLGIPPAFVPDPEAFEKMVKAKSLDKFSMTSRQITLYFGTITPGQVVTFSYPLKAKYPVKAKVPASTAYEYYAPDRKDTAEGVEITVNEK